MSYIKVENIIKEYTMGELTIKALDDVSFDVEEGEFIVIVGASGAGKTTLLNVLGGMDTLDSGEIVVNKRDISKYDRKMLTEYRRDDIGFVFQFYNLVQNLTAKENVELASEITKNPMNPKSALKMVGLEDRSDNFPSQLSGGEQQRVAIARALAKNPTLLLADEPTGALDFKTGKAILKLLQDTSRKENMTVILITHNASIVPIADKVIRMRSGKIYDIEINKEPMSVEGIEW